MATREHSKTRNIFLFVFVLGVIKKTSADGLGETNVLELLNRLDSKVDSLDSKLDVLDKKLDSLLAAEGETTDGVAQVRSSHAGIRIAAAAGAAAAAVVVVLVVVVVVVVVVVEVVVAVVVVVVTEAVTSINHSLGLYLEDTESDYAFQDLRNVSITRLETSPDIEAVYDPGDNITVTATVIPEHPSAGDLPRVTSYFYGLDLSSGDFKLIFVDNNGIIEKHAGSTLPDKAEVLVTVATANKALGGYLHLYVDVDIPEKTVLRNVQVAKMLTIRPSNQTGPFPPGYLTVLKDQHMFYRISDNGNELRTCK
ncbi:hypothetical protein ElyMa_006645200 [Elysia marginata]|uniref:Cadherin domain-containing protein n=1 Tax=Elysia marginata TaxID=1093978 RepID=A0AAV4IEN3_9GAST|nr:hypothetical protein ElyMa_006645200 [Elysia marginata]